jgi:peptidoglycan/xylan/chitin deacetylase (PgdA/CDA1 family)
MYHYVRDMKKTAYPNLKALDIEDFKQQIGYLERYYSFVSMEDVIRALYGEGSIPQNAVLLTFDDGYLDHYKYVYPVLTERQIQGSFFVPGRPVVEKVVLPVNKIQFLLAATSSIEELLRELYEFLDLFRTDFDLLPTKEYYSRAAHADYFDTQDVVFFKKMLSMELPVECRRRILNELFSKHVTEDERGFANDLYLSETQVKEMIKAGMYIGCHGYNHLWLGEVSRGEQERDISLALDFLGAVGANTDEWAITYPYESYNDSLVEVISDRGCKVGFVEREDIAKLDRNNAFHIARLDTNEFPKIATSKPNRWTEKIS